MNHPSTRGIALEHLFVMERLLALSSSFSFKSNASSNDSSQFPARIAAPICSRRVRIETTAGA